MGNKLIAQKGANPEDHAILDSLRSIRSKAPERAIRYARGILDDLGIEDRDLQSRVMHILGEIYLELGLPSLAMTNFIDAKQKSFAKINPWNDIGMGNVYRHQEKWIKAKKKYFQALDIFNRRNQESMNNLNGKAVALNCLGNVEFNLKNYDDALMHYKEALDVRRGSARYKVFQRSLTGSSATFPGIGMGVSYQHGRLARLYAEWGLNEMSLEQLNASDSLLSYVPSAVSDGVGKAIVRTKNIYLGNNHSLRMKIYADQKNFDGAYLESRSAIRLLHGTPLHLAKHYLRRSQIQSEQDSLYSALGSIDKALKICDLNGLSVLEIDLLDRKIELLESNKLEKSALGTASILFEKKATLSDDRMDMLLESLSYKAELDINQRALEQARSRESLIFIVVGSLMIIFGMVVINYRNRRRAATKDSLIHKQERLLAENELRTKETELIKMSANIVTKNDLLSSIDKDLEYHISLIDNKADRKVMDPLRKRIQGKIDDSADWDQFQLQFSLAYPDFVEDLSARYTGLRTADIKLCCYLKMSMNTKEIARVTGLSVRAIENKRYRLRKKLSLDTEISLDNFIHSFSVL